MPKIDGNIASGYACPQCGFQESDVLNIEVHVMTLECLRCKHIWLAEM